MGTQVASLMNSLLKVLGVYSPESLAIRRGHRIALVCLQKTREDVFYDEFGVPNDFFGQFQVQGFHMWMMHNRLRRIFNDGSADGDSVEMAKMIDHNMFESFWEKAIRDISNIDEVQSISTFKHLRDLQGRFFGGSVAYDQILGIDESLNNPAWSGLFASALYRNFSGLSEKVTAAELECMLWYAKDSIQELDSLPDSVVLEGEVPCWPEPTEFEGLTDQATVQGGQKATA